MHFYDFDHIYQLTLSKGPHLVKIHEQSMNNGYYLRSGARNIGQEI